MRPTAFLSVTDLLAAYRAGTVDSANRDSRMPSGTAAHKPSSAVGSRRPRAASNQSDEVPKKAYADMLAASGLTVKVNTVDHENFQENINNYLQGNPDDVIYN